MDSGPLIPFTSASIHPWPALETRVVLLTGYGSPEVERQAHECGADAYLEKTLPISVLLERVGALGFSTDPASSQREASA